MNEQHDRTDVKRVHHGWNVSNLSAFGLGVMTGIERMPRLVCELLESEGWRSFVVPYDSEQLMVYDDFETFVNAPSPTGLGMDLETLKHICQMNGTDEGTRALGLIAKTLQRHG